jgi:hypothetical protein
MTMNARLPIIVVLGLFVAVGCAGPTIEKKNAQSADPVLGMLHQGIIELNGSIEELTRHISDLQQMPPVPDPTIQELHALDLAGWQLHLQQWILQRDHLNFSVNQIQRVRADPQEKARIGSQWTDRQQQFVKTLEELTAHRQKLERKRLEVESQVLGQYFR